MIQAEIKMVINDYTTKNVRVWTEQRYNSALQSNELIYFVEKYVYKQENEIFNTNKLDKSPLYRCIFTSPSAFNHGFSFVEVFDNKNKTIHTGNYLHHNKRDIDFDSHLEKIKLMHDFKTITKNY